ncbi:signal recognition particle protein [Enterococcus pseudoavium]|uniref:Signal recognition particle protein n=1 Tax=Enterococcus pseudoavium TaxID=44007 RepID=A0ABU3FFK9_9ENTE|nr:signal recognition particle protein [Enterococcus pseudoavium]MDT2755233.1 signal recognition particle protein [Enterococcus pseudoavium]MDT2769817.1 signal recognition particle protein [Enterococcus pseudoavium]REC31974.1 signal recognition particle protein [Enterococcus pseudoavium]
MAFESLTQRLQAAMGKLRKKGKVTEADITEMMREIRLALLEADVNLQVVKQFTKEVRTRALGVEVMESLTPAQQIVKIVDEELTKTLGSEAVGLEKSPKIPTVIMMVGLQGAGKTTFAGKLANQLIKNEKARPLMIAGDIYRPAAIDQLKVLGQQLNVPVFDLGTEVSPVEIVRQGMEQARENKNDYVLIDTAGRLHIDEALMDELKQIKEVAQPNEILLVVDAMTGQDAVNVAQSFNEQLGITGVVITKLDGDTRGGAALSIRAVTGAPIKFVGSGEKLTDLEVFHPDRMSSRILGMGDMLTLIEKAQQDYDEKKAEELARKMKENTFDFNDFIEQLDQVMGMGPIEDLLKMIPGMSQMPGIENVKVDPKDVERKKAMVYSMTPAEREDPDLLNPSRRRRIAAGSGNSVVEVNRMIKQFKESRKMMQQMSKGTMPAGMDQMFGSGIKGKMGKMAMNRMVKKSKKKKKKRK